MHTRSLRRTTGRGWLLAPCCAALALTAATTALRAEESEANDSPATADPFAGDPFSLDDMRPLAEAAAGRIALLEQP